MKIVEKKKINESSLKTLSEVRQAAWDLANGMDVVDDLKNDVDYLLMALNDFFDAFEKGDIEKSNKIKINYVDKYRNKIQKQLRL